MLTDLYQGEIIASHNRYANCWRKDANAPSDSYGTRYPVTTKYSISENNTQNSNSSQVVNQQIIPMLRMSEIYLIAMETSDDLAEINTWYQSYMQEHAVATMPDFSSLSASKEWIIN